MSLSEHKKKKTTVKASLFSSFKLGKVQIVGIAISKFYDRHFFVVDFEKKQVLEMQLNNDKRWVHSLIVHLG
jgi:hypothetical protein